MKKICFIASHLSSGSSELFDVLDQNPRVQGFRSQRPYPDVPSLMEVTARPHKAGTAAAVYMDELLYNYSLQTKDAYRYCRFVYVVRRPEPTLTALVAAKSYTPEAACRYYCFRLRRMCEMARRTPGAVLLTWEDISTGRGLPLVEEYLNLKEPLAVPEMKKGTSATLVPFGLLSSAEQCYERYLAYLYAQDIRYWI